MDLNTLRPASDRLPSPVEREKADAVYVRIRKAYGRQQRVPLDLSDLPEPAVELLVRILDQLRRGRAVTIVPHGAELTTQQAADFLGVSRPYVVKLIETGRLPHSKVGVRRRVRFEDLVAFQQSDRRQRDALLDGLSADFELERAK